MEEQTKKELEKLKTLSLFPIAEDIYHTFTIMDLSDNELDLLLTHNNILETLATKIQESDIYDILISNTIDDLLDRQ